MEVETKIIGISDATPVMPPIRPPTDSEDHTPPLLGTRASEVKSAVHRELIAKLDLEKLLKVRDGRGQPQLLSMIRQLVGQQGVPLSASERDRLSLEVLDEVFGLGPLEPLLQDPTVNDILVNTYNTVYVERGGIRWKPRLYSRTTST